MAAAASAPFLKAFSIIAGGALLSLSAAKAEEAGDQDFAATKIKTAAFFIANILPLAEAHLKIAAQGSRFV